VNLPRRSAGQPYPISQLSQGSRLTRQAITNIFKCWKEYEWYKAFVRAARAYSNSIPSQLEKSGNTPNVSLTVRITPSAG